MVHMTLNLVLVVALVARNVAIADSQFKIFDRFVNETVIELDMLHRTPANATDMFQVIRAHISTWTTYAEQQRTITPEFAKYQVALIMRRLLFPFRNCVRRAAKQICEAMPYDIIVYQAFVVGYFDLFGTLMTKAFTNSDSDSFVRNVASVVNALVSLRVDEALDGDNVLTCNVRHPTATIMLSIQFVRRVRETYAPRSHRIDNYFDSLVCLIINRTQVILDSSYTTLPYPSSWVHQDALANWFVSRHELTQILSSRLTPMTTWYKVVAQSMFDESSEKQEDFDLVYEGDTVAHAELKYDDTTFDVQTMQTSKELVCDTLTKTFNFLATLRMLHKNFATTFVLCRLYGSHEELVRHSKSFYNVKSWSDCDTENQDGMSGESIDQHSVVYRDDISSNETVYGPLIQVRFSRSDIFSEQKRWEIARTICAYVLANIIPGSPRHQQRTLSSVTPLSLEMPHQATCTLCAHLTRQITRVPGKAGGALDAGSPFYERLCKDRNAIILINKMVDNNEQRLFRDAYTASQAAFVDFAYERELINQTRPSMEFVRLWSLAFKYRIHILTSPTTLQSLSTHNLNYLQSERDLKYKASDFEQWMDRQCVQYTFDTAALRATTLNDQFPVSNNPFVSTLSRLGTTDAVAIVDVPVCTVNGRTYYISITDDGRVLPRILNSTVNPSKTQHLDHSTSDNENKFFFGAVTFFLFSFHVCLDKVDDYYPHPKTNRVIYAHIAASTARTVRRRLAANNYKWTSFVHTSIEWPLSNYDRHIVEYALNEILSPAFRVPFDYRLRLQHRRQICAHNTSNSDADATNERNELTTATLRAWRSFYNETTFESERIFTIAPNDYAKNAFRLYAIETTIELRRPSSIIVLPSTSLQQQGPTTISQHRTPIDLIEPTVTVAKITTVKKLSIFNSWWWTLTPFLSVSLLGIVVLLGVVTRYTLRVRPTDEECRRSETVMSLVNRRRNCRTTNIVCPTGGAADEFVIVPCKSDGETDDNESTGGCFGGKCGKKKHNNAKKKATQVNFVVHR